MTWGEIQAAIDASSLPYPNLALVSSCSSVASFSTVGDSFRVGGRDDAGFAGFDGLLRQQLYVDPEQPFAAHLSLARHVESVCNGMRKGLRLDQALDHTNRHYTPALWVPGQGPHTELRMKIPSNVDPFTRVIGVYYSAAELANNSSLE